MATPTRRAQHDAKGNPGYKQVPDEKRDHQPKHSGEGYGGGPHCPKLSCCQELLNKLGVPDPTNADLYDVLIQLINNNVEEPNIDIDLEIPYPERTLFVSHVWSAEIDEDVLFTDLPAALLAAAALGPTFDLPVTVQVYTGIYPAIVLPGNVNLVANGKVVIAGLTYNGSALADPQESRVQGIEIAGPVNIDTSAATSEEPIGISFEHVLFHAFPFSGTLRASVGGLALTASDVINIRDSTINSGSITVSVVGDSLTIARFEILNSRINVPGDVNILGAPVVVPFLRGTRVRKLDASPSTKQPKRTTIIRSNKRGRTGTLFVQRSILPDGAPAYPLFFEVSNAEQFMVGAMNITGVNTLFENDYIAAQGPGDATANVTVTDGVFNAKNVTLQSNAFLALAGTAVAALMNCDYEETQLTATGAAAANRTLTVGGGSADALTLAGAFGLVANLTVPYVDVDYVVTASVVSAALVGTPTLPTVTTKTASGFEFAFSSTAFVGEIEYALHHATVPLDFA